MTGLKFEVWRVTLSRLKPVLLKVLLNTRAISVVALATPSKPFVTFEPCKIIPIAR